MLKYSRMKSDRHLHNLHSTGLEGRKCVCVNVCVCVCKEEERKCGKMLTMLQLLGEDMDVHYIIP